MTIKVQRIPDTLPPKKTYPESSYLKLRARKNGKNKRCSAIHSCNLPKRLVITSMEDTKMSKINDSWSKFKEFSSTHIRIKDDKQKDTNFCRRKGSTLVKKRGCIHMIHIKTKNQPEEEGGNDEQGGSEGRC